MVKVTLLSLGESPWSRKNSSSKALEGKWEMSKTKHAFSKFIPSWEGWKRLHHMHLSPSFARVPSKNLCWEEKQLRCLRCHHPSPKVMQGTSVPSQLSQNRFEEHVYLHSLEFAWKQLRWGECTAHSISYSNSPLLKTYSGNILDCTSEICLEFI